jgi:hypothetical protein
MGGAFTAVADDATATFWNPAGLASGAFGAVTVDVNALDRGTAGFVGLATPPLGLSYYRTSTERGVNDRNGLVVHHAGVTVVQSLGDRGLAVGATLKLVHGNGASAFDADVGLMAAGALGKIGLTVHHVSGPSLGDLELQRRVRGGLALNVRQTVTVAADVEFNRTLSPTGEWRDAALGMEAHPQARTWLRSGVHWNTGGAGAAPVGSVGGSFAVHGSIRADAQASFGSRQGNRGWGVGVSFVY